MNFYFIAPNERLIRRVWHDENEHIISIEQSRRFQQFKIKVALRRNLTQQERDELGSKECVVFVCWQPCFVECPVTVTHSSSSRKKLQSSHTNITSVRRSFVENFGSNSRFCGSILPAIFPGAILECRRDGVNLRGTAENCDFPRGVEKVEFSSRTEQSWTKKVCVCVRVCNTFFSSSVSVNTLRVSVCAKEKNKDNHSRKQEEEQIRVGRVRIFQWDHYFP